MDLSIFGYLSRRNTEMLQALLQNYSQPELLSDYCDTVEMIIEILTDRGVEIPSEIFVRITDFRNNV